MGQQEVEGREPLIDVAADEELIRGAALQLDDLGRGGPGGRLLIGVRRLGAPAGVGQRVSEPNSQRLIPPALLRPEHQRQPVELGRPFEGQRPRGVFGRAAEEFAGPRRFSRALVVNRQRLEVSPIRCFQRPGEASMVVPQGLGREMGDDGLADAIMVGLNLVTPFRALVSDQASCAEHGAAPADPLVQARRPDMLRRATRAAPRQQRL